MKEVVVNSRPSVGINLQTLDILSKYMSKSDALEAAKEIELLMYKERQYLKDIIVGELRTDIKEGSLSSRSVEIIDKKFDYRTVTQRSVDDIDFSGIPEEYKE